MEEIEMSEIEVAHISRDTSGKIIVDKDGYITCIYEGGLNFRVAYDEINFENDTLECSIEGKEIYIRLHENEANKENCSSAESNINKTFAWSDASTKLFLTLYKEKKDLLTNRKIKTRKILWQTICEDMKKEGYDLTTTQVENKMKSLERSYKNMITNNKQTGRGRVTCPYETELTELLGYKHNIEPVATSGRGGTVIRQDKVGAQTGTREKEVCTNTNEEQEQNMYANSSNNGMDLFIDEEEDALNRIFTQSNEPPKKIRKQVGATGRLLEKCNSTLDKLTENILTERNERSDVQKQILAQYTRITTIYEDLANNMKEQLSSANNLRQERNVLLRQLIATNRINEGEYF